MDGGNLEKALRQQRCGPWRNGLRPRRALALCLAMSLLASPHLRPAAAQDGSRPCSEGFAGWVKRSEDSLKTQPKRGAQPGDPAKEACVPSESVRKTLQRALASLRRKCQGADASSKDAVATLPLLEINADAITNMPLCGAGKPPGTIAQPQECVSLELREGVHWLTNANCGGRKVIVVVEIKLSSGILKCRGHVVTSSTKLGTTRPILNYECVQNERDCSVKSVKAIFPYCSW